ncbi:uncharacterized protein H6S33_000488 [Morchella sextelata]|uniref:uncharacterized protein n=1 Tax=Morchella sextelata TaxID=1174677 RepID=UPI001D04695D|nr:uncharacterized protein H6S33_000488 [Morchella sextelata]KAH0614852.1 hypothetical protein H6S33_000488 [Morchella sextelata]
MASSSASTTGSSNPQQSLSQLDPIDISSHSFSTPSKRIHNQQDVDYFPTSPAYKLITTFILHLNASVSPLDHSTNALRNPAHYTLVSETINVSPAVQNIIELLHALDSLITQAPPDPGPRRFGNVAFRKWHDLVASSVPTLLDQRLPPHIASHPGTKAELLPYLLGSFGSAQRLDYGTGHELSFAAFLCCLWVLGGFEPGRDEIALTLRCFDAYFHLVRRLVLTYTLEPAGSHGVWGLDDHAFLPYVFGSAQLTTYPPSSSSGEAAAAAAEAPKMVDPAVASALEDVPKPGDVVTSLVVERERVRNLYFGAVGFIYDVKTGPFWEHSPILYDISGVQGGWGKINKGMLKMYNAEVLGKFPVVQHFPFGSIFNWGAPSHSNTTAATTQHQSNINNSSSSSTSRGMPDTGAPTSAPTTRAPWATATNNSSSASLSNTGATTRAPWAAAGTPSSSASITPSTRAPWAKPPAPDNVMTTKSGEQPLTTAPWAAPQVPLYPTSAGMSAAHHPPPPRQLSGEDTVAPWKLGGEGGAEAVPPPPVTEANLGPKRTSSPDSRLAASLDGEEAEKRRGSLGTGGVRVAETGDLSLGRKGSVVKGENE